MLTVTEHDAIAIRGGRVIDPFSGRDETGDVNVVNGRIVSAAPAGAHVIDATAWIICPGLIDIHVHLREPGQTHKETIETGTAAAAAGGFTYVACMPNTKPTLDQTTAIAFVLDSADKAGHCEVGPVGAITRERSGREIVDFAELQRAGAVAFSDDGTGVEDDGVMRRAFQGAHDVGAVVIQHCEYQTISAGGVLHAGEVARRLGLPGLDPRSEEAMIERDIALCRETSARYHVAHVSTGKAVELVRQAKGDGLPVTAEVAPHHLLLTHEDCAQGDPNTKMHPPLRGRADVEACLCGLIDGTIDCIATDHAPHTMQEKEAGFLKAPPGIVGLETAVALAARAMIESQRAQWPQLIAWLTSGPTAVLGLDPRPIEVGAAANLALIDPNAKWTVDPARFESKGRNTPFAGWTLNSRPIGTIRGQRWSRADHPPPAR